MNRKEGQIKKELASWIDTYVIAEAVVNAIEEAERPLTLKLGKAVYLDFLLTELSDAMQASARYARIDEEEVKV